jgi:hypothetical protein
MLQLTPHAGTVRQKQGGTWVARHTGCQLRERHCPPRSMLAMGLHHYLLSDTRTVKSAGQRLPNRSLRTQLLLDNRVLWVLLYLAAPAPRMMASAAAVASDWAWVVFMAHETYTPVSSCLSGSPSALGDCTAPLPLAPAAAAGTAGASSTVTKPAGLRGSLALKPPAAAPAPAAW